MHKLHKHTKEIRHSAEAGEEDSIFSLKYGESLLKETALAAIYNAILIVSYRSTPDYSHRTIELSKIRHKTQAVA